MGITPERAVEIAIDSSDAIGEVTKKNYKLQFANLVRLAGGSATTVFRDPQKVYDAMLDEYPSALTRRALLTVARSILKLLPEARARFPGASDKYAELQRTDPGIAKETARLMEGRLNERERETYVPWNSIIEARERLEKEEPSSVQTLLLSMYTYIEPVRQDYGNVKILYAEPRPNSGIPNFIVLDREDRDTATLTISDYKTAKKYGVHKRHLPKELVEVVWKSLEEKPRDYLFVDSKGMPFEKKNSFVQWTNRSLYNIFEGRKVTVNTLRHSFISNLDFNSKTPGDILRSARMMGHSVNQQQLYRRLPTEEDGDFGKKKATKKERHVSPAPEPPRRPDIVRRDEERKPSAPVAQRSGGIIVERQGRDRAETLPRRPNWGERGEFFVSL